ncbi:PIN domain-like protein [Tylopilus felleus]
MGVKGLWPILSRAAERRSLLEFTVNEGFQHVAAGLKLLKIGVDASTWMHSVCPVFRHHHAGAGQNPELRTLFYRLAAILAMPAHVVFMFDGPGRPQVKRGKQVRGRSHWLARPFQELIDAFGFQWHEAPAEAEAELAVLSQHGLIDLVLTTDVDALVFGATCVARCPDSPRHFENIEIYTDQSVSTRLGLTRAELVLVALLVGGDHSDGLPGCGINIAHGLTHYRLGDALSEAFATMDVDTFTQFLVRWRNKLRSILGTDPDGVLDRHYLKLAETIPDAFPNYTDLEYYFSPLTRSAAHNSNSPLLALEPKSSQPCLAALAAFCRCHFGLEHEALVTKMRTTVWEGVAVRQLCNVTTLTLFIPQPNVDNT